MLGTESSCVQHFLRMASGARCVEVQTQSVRIYIRLVVVVGRLQHRPDEVKVITEGQLRDPPAVSLKLSPKERSAHTGRSALILSEEVR